MIFFSGWNLDWDDDDDDDGDDDDDDDRERSKGGSQDRVHLLGGARLLSHAPWHPSTPTQLQAVGMIFFNLFVFVIFVSQNKCT